MVNVTVENEGKVHTCDGILHIGITTCNNTDETIDGRTMIVGIATTQDVADALILLVKTIIEEAIKNDPDGANVLKKLKRRLRKEIICQSEEREDAR